MVSFGIGASSGAAPQTNAQKMGAGSAREPREITMPTGSLGRCFSVAAFIYSRMRSSRMSSEGADEPDRGQRRERFAAMRPAAQSRLRHPLRHPRCQEWRGRQVTCCQQHTKKEAGVERRPVLLRHDRFHKAVSFRHAQVISFRARSISLLPSFSKDSDQPS